MCTESVGRTRSLKMWSSTASHLCYIVNDHKSGDLGQPTVRRSCRSATRPIATDGLGDRVAKLGSLEPVLVDDPGNRAIGHRAH